MSAVRKNKEHEKAQATYNMFKGDDEDDAAKRVTNQMENIIDIRFEKFITVLTLASRKDVFENQDQQNATTLT